MPTTTVKTIGTGGDYTTLQAWEDAAAANLVTADEVWEGQLKNQNFSSASNLLAVGGSTTDATRFKRLRCEAGASFRDNASVQTNRLYPNSANGACITLTGSYAKAITVGENFCQFIGLQVDCVPAAGRATTLECLGWQGVIINFSLLAGYAPYPSFTLQGQGGAAESYIANSLVVSHGGAAAVIANVQVNASAYNCTFVTPSDLTKATDGVSFTYSTGGTFRNNAVFGATNALTLGGAGTVTSNYCDDASPPSGFTQIAFDTSTGSGFEGITEAARDFRIKSTSALKDAGTTDSTYAATDVAGTSRPSASAYDVGCWEYVSAAADTLWAQACL